MSITKHSFSAFILTLLVGVLMNSCQSDKKPQVIKLPEPKKLEIPKFEKDSAYAFIEKQLSFGPRVVGTEGHAKCRDWLVNKLESYGWSPIVQEFSSKRYDGVPLTGYNIIGSYKPEKKKRVLLCAHWDTRHIADEDPDPSNHDKPIPGADDGGSGVAVLIEIARLLSQEDINLGVDIVFFDAEDLGKSDEKENTNETWALGSQYWSKNLHKSGYSAKFGILLDMVGSKGARFPREGYSAQLAGRYLDKIWSLAQRLGYGNYFVLKNDSYIADDHLYVNQYAKIPTVDIINRTEKLKFGDYWHTMADDIDIIDKRTLRAVGKTVLNVLYLESQGKF